MGILDPYGLIPNISYQDMTIITADNINILWGENPNFTPADFVQFVPEFTGLVEGGPIPVLTYSDTANMVADQANQTIGLAYQVDADVYVLDVKTGDLSDYTITTTAALYNALFGVYAIIASSEISEKRYNDMWKYAMSLYIAHKLTVRLMVITKTNGLTDALTRARVISSSAPYTVSSESVGGVSVSYETGTTIKVGLDGGDWNRTQYGQELVTLFANYGMGAWIIGM